MERLEQIEDLLQMNSIAPLLKMLEEDLPTELVQRVDSRIEEIALERIEEGYAGSYNILTKKGVPKRLRRLAGEHLIDLYIQDEDFEDLGIISGMIGDLRHVFLGDLPEDIIDRAVASLDIISQRAIDKTEDPYMLFKISRSKYVPAHYKTLAGIKGVKVCVEKGDYFDLLVHYIPISPEPVLSFAKESLEEACLTAIETGSEYRLNEMVKDSRLSERVRKLASAKLK